MVNDIYLNAKNRMNKTIEHFTLEISSVRTSRAAPSLVDTIAVDYYGTPTPLKNIAHVSTPDPQLIVIQPFDPTSLEMIEKSILNSDTGLNPNNDGNIIRLSIPALTEERRKELVKVVFKYAEASKISVRNIRRDTNDQLKKEKDNGLSEDNFDRALENIQELTDEKIKSISTVAENKEKDILS